MTLSKEGPSSSSEIKYLPRYDATYWLKWTAGNDVRVRASGVGRRGWNVVCVGVVALEHILLPPIALLHSDLMLGQQ